MVVKILSLRTRRGSEELVEGVRPEHLALEDTAEVSCGGVDGVLHGGLTGGVVSGLRFDLERGGLIVGRVRSDDGDPLPGVTVSCGVSNGRSDVRGDFRLEGVPPGRCTVEAKAGGRHASEELEVRADEESRLDLRLVR